MADGHFDPSTAHVATEKGPDPRAESSRSMGRDDDVFSDQSPHSSTADDYDPAPANSAPCDGDDYHNDAHAQDVPKSAPTANPIQVQTRPFRPSVDVNRALAVSMSSPPPSLFSSPRSATKRTSGMSQFSPRGRNTPSRFRARKESPALVLLHVTVLPLRWAWADVLDRAGDDDQLTPSLRSLREGWRQLQDRVGDGVLERGVLLAHPQDDYDLLEERLLDALELPLLRRARILECGHYIGPANEPDPAPNPESTSGYDDASVEPEVHWCGTCRHDIRFEALGPGKVFRVKVYASNGLIRAGAWSACWREMERVDVELEPITEGDIIAELERLAVDLHIDDEDLPERVRSRLSRSHTSQSHRGAPKSPSPHGDYDPATTPKTDEERRMRQDARLREIYGHTPPHRPQSSYMSPSPSPSIRARSRERPRNVSFGYPNNIDDDKAPEARPHDSHPTTKPANGHSPKKPAATTPLRPIRRDMKDATLPQLVIEALCVFASDGKGMAVIFLAIVAGLLAIRGPPQWSNQDSFIVVPNPMSNEVAAYGSNDAHFSEHESGLALLRDLSTIDQGPMDDDSDDFDRPRTNKKVHVHVETVTKIATETATVTETKTATETALSAELVVKLLEDAGDSAHAREIFAALQRDPCEACRDCIV